MHRSAAEAYLPMRGLADTYQAATVRAKEPRLRAEALALQGHIAGLTPQLAREVNSEETPALAQQGHKAWIATGGRHGRLTLDPAEDRLGASGSG